MKSSEPGRRRYRRRAVQVEVTLRFRPPRVLRAQQAILSLVGRTRDMSEAGLAIVVSAGNIDRYLKQEENSFDVEMNLPDGLLTFEVTPVHYKRFMTATGMSYIIGSRLNELEPEKLDRLLEFLKSLPLV
jgi:PilZ domain